ncbi:MAG: restriction endonuclease subunit S [Verrucomicrobiia bacterium]
MANEWLDLPFSEAVLVNPTTSLERGKVYPFVEMAAISAGTRDVKCSEQREFSGGGSKFRDRDTLMARITPCLENGKIARFQAPEGQPVGHGSTEFIVIRGRPDVSDNDFAYYLTISPEVRHFAISQMTGSSGRQRVPTDAFDAISIPLPPLDEQKAIASVLGALDDKIELNRRTNVTLEAMAQTLFKSLFQISDAATLSEGWREVSFSETIEVLGGGTPKTSNPEYWNGDIPWFSVVDAPSDSDVFVIDTEKKITRAGVENSSTQILPVGTTIISARGTVGKVALVGVPMAMNQSCYGIRGTIGKKGFFSYFSTHALVSTLQQRAHGSVFDTITRDTFSSVRVIAPPMPIVEKFEEDISPLMTRILGNLFESRKLARLRDTLLPKLLIGELSVADLVAKGTEVGK